MISVVTLTYNNYEELVKTLDSIRGLSEIESVVINGGSCTKTLEYLKTHIGTVINEKDQGIADAFNKGIKASRGDAIAFLNSGDVLIDRDYYSLADQTLNQNPTVHYVYADLLFDDAIAGKILFRGTKPSLLRIGRGMPFGHPTMVTRKRVFEIVGNFNLNFKISMDYEWLIRVLKQDFKSKYLLKTCVMMDGLGVSATAEEKAILECKRALKDNGLDDPATQKDIDRRLLKFKIRRSLQRFLGPKALKLAKKLKHKLQLL